MNMIISTDPEHIAISKSQGIKIDWKDGHHSEYRLTYLRDKKQLEKLVGAMRRISGVRDVERLFH